MQAVSPTQEGLPIETIPHVEHARVALQRADADNAVERVER